MSLCAAVKALAELVAAIKTPSDPWHLLFVEMLRLMPLYHDIGRLDAWEGAIQEAVPEKDDQSEIGMVLNEIFDFGRLNLYTRFNEGETRREYDILRERLMEAGILAGPAPYLQGW